MAEIARQPKGTFAISLDFELIWGTLDLFGTSGFGKDCMAERDQVIDRLLELFVDFEVPATWCTIGHLFLDRCQPQDGVKHPEIVRPSHKWYPHDWFAHDPCGTEDSQPLFYGRSLISKIRSCPVPQEIGSHSFSHIIFGDEGCSRQAAESDLAACVQAAGEVGLRLRSFVFPRNEPGHIDLLADHGFICYRGPEPNDWISPKWPSMVGRLARLAEVILASTPPVVAPVREDRIINIPGSMIYFPSHGLRRHIPMSLRVKRAVKGLNEAAAQKRIFHLWFHPTNMAGNQSTMGAMFDGLRRILQHAAALRDRGVIDFLSMVQIAEAAMNPAPLLGDRAQVAVQSEHSVVDARAAVPIGD
ncbi:MAG TPA: hypothetical protein VI756_20265 [Blastocatellia bacterium]